MNSHAAFLIAVSLISAAQAQPVKRNIPYAEPAGELQTLDVYSPENAKNLPVIFWIHGGGWQTGDKASAQKAQGLRRQRVCLRLDQLPAAAEGGH